MRHAMWTVRRVMARVLDRGARWVAGEPQLIERDGRLFVEVDGRLRPAIAGGANHYRRWKKSAIGATTVTLIPSTYVAAVYPDGEPAPTQVVFTYPGTPPPTQWGTAVTDGDEYLLHVKSVT